MQNGQDGGSSTILHTERLKLRLADPSSQSDCQELLRIYTHPQEGGGSASGIQTLADIQQKHKRHGPRADYCTLAPAPNGMFFLIYLPSHGTSKQDAGAAEETLVGKITMSFRPEMPYPDIGYAVLPAYEKNGYATEAGKAVIRFWQDVIGVKEMFLGTAPYNVKSQKTAERLGFVRAGTFDVLIGLPPNEKRETGGLAYVLPGMQWIDGKTMKLAIGPETEAPEQYDPEG